MNELNWIELNQFITVIINEWNWSAFEFEYWLDTHMCLSKVGSWRLSEVCVKVWRTKDITAVRYISKFIELIFDWII